MAAAAVEMTTGTETMGKDFSSSGRKGRRNALTMDGQSDNAVQLSDEMKLELETKALQALSLDASGNNNNDDESNKQTK